MSSPTTLKEAAPVGTSERIQVLDALRGIAILGILLMNIGMFSMPVYGHDPTVKNEFGTINFQIWHAVDWFPEGTQRALFSMLFGAGILLFISRQEKKVDGLWPADYFFRRQLWLLVFGLIDIYILLWMGDILFDYACYGMIMFAFRRLPVKKLLIGAGVCFLLMVARENRDFYLDKKMISKGEAAAAIDTTKTKLTDVQKGDIEEMNSFKAKFTHEAKIKKMNKDIKAQTSGYENLYEYRTNIYQGFIIHYSYMSIWDVLLFMFLGMAFFKSGVITGQAPTKVYAWLCVIGLGLGLFISWFRLRQELQYNFNWFEYTKHVSFSSYEISRTPRSLGIFGLIMLLYKSGWFKWFFAIMKPTGQMAFTNYLTQSIICGITFYGIGFGYMGKFERYEAYLFVGCVWVLQIIWSNIWLRYFNFGPLEWLWRSLTYWKKQPMRRR